MEKIIEKAKAAGWSCRERDGELRITFPDKETMTLRRAGTRLTCTPSESVLDFLKANYSLSLMQSGGISADSSDIVGFLNELETKFTRTAREKLEKFRKKLEGVGETEARAETMVRRGQEALRALLLAERHACEISGAARGELLVASHIVPWAECESARLDPENVLLLAKNWDALFDAHLISFDSETGELVKAERLSDADFRALTGREATDATTKIRIPVNTDARRAYLRAHLDCLRKKDAEEA